MCFGSSPNITTTAPPKVTPPPKSAPLPSATPTLVQSQVTATDRRKKIAAMRHGMLSTIKTSPQGIVGTGTNLSGSGAGKKTLGE